MAGDRGRKIDAEIAGEAKVSRSRCVFETERLIWVCGTCVRLQEGLIELGFEF